ncbi:hypothetical protein [Nostoc sp. CALU 546]|uniref:hypothetical protein n=1 Tax=Nostoc sp. CALU 546 TaxID=1867241 RepID=UPI003B680AB0
MGTIIFKALASEVIENYLKPTRHFFVNLYDATNPAIANNSKSQDFPRSQSTS